MESKMTDYQHYIAKSRYARYIPEKKRRETWKETVDRYVSFFSQRFPDTYPAEIIREAIYNLEVMPSMRGLMTAGKALDRDECAIYNCSYVPVDDIRAFDETLYLLMTGCGVGFSVERQLVAKLPDVSEEMVEVDTTIVVKDSRIGWASAFRQLLSLLYQGQIPKWDLSNLRPEGAPLKTFGGRSSGPKPLDDLFKFTTELFKRASGRKLNSIECNDLMCKVADIVVVGGVRRSALISLSNLSDDRMRHAKNGQWWIDNGHRALANNSVCYTEKPEMLTFMNEWTALYESKSGERGIFNRQAAKKKSKKAGRRDVNHEFGINPCQPAFATLLTPNGIRTMGEVSIGDIIWSGERWTRIVNKINTGVKEVKSYNTNAGCFVGTENHRIVQNGKKVEVKDAISIDISKAERSPTVGNDLSINWSAVMDGLVVGDGSVHKASNGLVYLNIGRRDQDYFEYEGLKELILKDRTKSFKTGWEIETSISPSELKKTYERKIPERFHKGTRNEVRSFLLGLYSANGSVCGGRVTLKQSSLGLIRQVQEMLSSIGISSYITTNKTSKVKFRNGEYQVKQSYDLNISTDRELFYSEIGFLQRHKLSKLSQIVNISGNRKKITYDINGIDSLGFHEVFDITVEADEHTYWTGGLLVSNCGEIILRPNGFCNLTEVVIKPHDTPETLKRKLEIATIIGTFQATMTNFRYLRSVWKKNAEEERLVGVSMTGIMDNEYFSGKIQGDEHLDVSLQLLKEHVIEVNRVWAEKLGINPSPACTTTKPSGTVGELVGSSSGIHSRFSPYYLRRVRNDIKDPLCKFLMEQGIPHEPDVTKPNSTMVFEFPMKSPETSTFANEMSAIDQLEHYLMYATHWTEHNPSTTIYVKEDEWLKVAAWVYEHFDEINGVSFLPYSDHIYKQAPFEPITEERYNELVKNFPKINWEEYNVEEHEDNVKGVQTLACTGGVCMMES